MRILSFTDLTSQQVVQAYQANDGNWYQVKFQDGHFHDLGHKITPGKAHPCFTPRAIFCAGVNYADHAKEFGSQQQSHPTVFMKSPACVTAHQSTVYLPRFLRSDMVDYEGELAVVIARDCKNVKPSQALDYVLGYCCANDISARDWQKQWGGGQWSRGKSFDTFCPIGPALVTADEIPNPQDLHLTFRLNGEVRQSAHTSQMQYGVAELIAFLSGSSTLPAGSMILTGTPSGVGMGQHPPQFLKPGDVMEVEINGLGSLQNIVQEEVL
jgi:2-keto-4-pentenoate hydratase/2-oxohepta-3-ene-1,7-dioic acid hydratase in catechol pathway